MKLSLTGCASIDHDADWSEFKKWLDGTYARLRHTWTEDANTYTVIANDGIVFRLVGINKDNSQAHTDFEANYKTTAVLDASKALDGRTIVKTSVGIPGNLFQLRPISLQTSVPSSLHNAKPDGTSHNDVTVKEYDSNGDELTTTFTTAVKTVIDFEAVADYELLGGWLEIDDSISTAGVGIWYLSVCGAPDVPVQYGGCIPFLGEVDLALLQSKSISMDGRATSFIKYDPVYHSGKIRFTIKHPPGAIIGFQIFLEIFK
jgi:hypothetical protein